MAFGLSPSVVNGSQDAAQPAQAALRLLNEGRFAPARGRVLQAITQSRGDARLRLLQARIYLELEEPDDAQISLDQAGERGATPEQFVLLLAHRYLLTGDAARGAALLDGYSPRAGEQAYALRLRVRAAALLGQWDKVAAMTQDAERLSPQSPALWTEIALQHSVAGNLGAAYAALGKAQVDKSRYVPLIVLKGDLARKRYGLASSIPHYRRALAQDPGNLPALVALAATWGDMGANREMLAVTRQILAGHPHNGWAWYFQAVMAARAGRYELARSMTDRMGEGFNNWPGVLLLRGALDLEGGAPQRAILTLRRLVAMEPQHLGARRLLARAYQQAGDHRAALLALEPLVNRADADRYSLTLMARLLEEEGERDQAMAFLARASDPKPPAPQALLLRTAQDAARQGKLATLAHGLAQLWTKGQRDDAMKQAEIVRRRHNGHASAHLMAGDSSALAGQWSAAVSAYRDAANLDFSEGTALRFARALTQSGQAQQAFEVLTLYLRENPQSLAVRRALADAAAQARAWPEAARALEIIRDRLGNRDAMLLVDLGWAYHQMGDNRRALKFMDAATALQPDEPRVKVARAAIVQASGDRTRAFALMAAARADPRLAGSMPRP